MWTRCSSLTCGNLTIAKQVPGTRVSLSPCYGKRWLLPSDRVWQPCQRETLQENPSASQGKQAESKYLKHTYTKGGQQTLKKANPSSYFGNSQSYSAKKSSYLNIFLSGSTTDRTGQVLLIKTQEIFFSSGYQSTIPCSPKQTYHTTL